jgi:TonB family protein
MKPRRSHLALVLLPLLAVPSSFGWGSKGHTYLGPEPDRWRSRAEPELNAAQAPDHFIDIEYADLIGPLPRQRYQYIAALYAYIAAHPDRAADLQPEKVGFQPYVTSEVWERLKSAMRDYRTLSAAHQDTKPVEAAILFYAGWLGHYVGDGSQPLHVTIQYNGWVGPNPNGYTTDHKIHSQFETAFVDAAINVSDVQPLLAPLHPINDEWDDYLAYLRHTGSLTERVYQLDKQHGFDAEGTPESKQFTAERLAAGASMLRDLYVAAWIKSAEPVPDWHDQHTQPAAASGSDPAAAAAAPQEAGPDIEEIDPTLGPVYKVRPGMTVPVIVWAPDPEYSNEARRKKLTGSVLVSAIVGTDGHTHDVQAASHLGMGLDENAVKAVQQYRFQPATYQAKPVPTRVNIKVDFHLYDSRIAK